MVWLWCEHCRRRRSAARVVEGEFWLVRCDRLGWQGVVCSRCGRRVLQLMSLRFNVVSISLSHVLDFVHAQARSDGDVVDDGGEDNGND